MHVAARLVCEGFVGGDVSLVAIHIILHLCSVECTSVIAWYDLPTSQLMQALGDRGAANMRA